MAYIKNLHLLSDIVKQSDIDKMEQGALMHARYGNITFKIVEASTKKVIIQAVQGKSATENYAGKKRLIEIVHETFDRFFPGMKIHVHPVEYKVPDPNQVNQEWIVEQMKSTGTRLKEMAEDTGIDYTQLSRAVNGETLSQPMKALFWYYFLSKRHEAGLKLLGEQQSGLQKYKINQAKKSGTDG